MKLIGFILLAAVITLTSASIVVRAQTETATGVEVSKDIELLRKDLRGEKKKIIAANVPFTEEESTRFWPIYDQYALDMKKSYDEFYTLIADYAANQKTLNDAQAQTMIKRWGDLQVDLARTRQKYVAILEKVIPAKKSALFFQIDRRLYALIDLQAATGVPLVYQ
jgi:hypothetical protein